MQTIFGPNPRIALVPRGGPENGPFSAMVALVLDKILSENGFKISAIYPCSGSTPTALLGCTGDFAKLCDIWSKIEPNDIVGEISKIKTTQLT